MAKLTIEQLDLAGKRVFLRADLNAPLNHGAVSDDTRLAAVVPTIRHALGAGASVVLASHLGRPKGGPDPKYSLAPVAERMARAGRRAIAYDNRGSGASTVTPGPYTTAGLAADAVALLDHPRDRAR